MNSLLQHGYISKLPILKTDAQYSKAAEANILWFKNLLYSDIYLLDTNIDGTVCSAKKKGRGSDSIDSSPRCTPALIQFSI